MKITNEKLENIRKGIVYYANAVFTSFLSGYLLLFLFESYKEGFVSYYFNLNYFLWILGISGVLLVLFKEECDYKKAELTYKDKALIIFMGMIGGIIMYLQTIDIGAFSFLIGIVSAAIIILLSFVLMGGSNKK